MIYEREDDKSEAEWLIWHKDQGMIIAKSS